MTAPTQDHDRAMSHLAIARTLRNAKEAKHRTLRSWRGWTDEVTLAELLNELDNAIRYLTHTREIFDRISRERNTQ